MSSKVQASVTRQRSRRRFAADSEAGPLAGGVPVKWRDFQYVW